jgi:hypothetical protein
MVDLDSEQNSILYRESHLVDEIVHSRKTLVRHRTIFDQLWSLALDEEASAHMIAERATAMTMATAGADSSSVPAPWR